MYTKLCLSTTVIKINVKCTFNLPNVYIYIVKIHVSVVKIKCTFILSNVCTLSNVCYIFKFVSSVFVDVYIFLYPHSTNPDNDYDHPVHL